MFLPIIYLSLHMSIHPVCVCYMVNVLFCHIGYKVIIPGCMMGHKTKEVWPIGQPHSIAVAHVGERNNATGAPKMGTE